MNSRRKKPLYAGIDIARGAWIVVVINDDGFHAAHYAPTLTDLTHELAACHTVAIDVPLALSDTAVRACDVHCRDVLGVRRSSLFFTPVRAALDAPTHAKASVVNKNATGKGISVQAYALRHKIFDAHRFLTQTGITMLETHPETTFTVLAGEPFSTAKSTWAGIKQRERLLETHGVTLDDCLPAGAKAGPDDMVDAAVAALTARRYAHGDATPFGDGTVDHTIGVAQTIYA